MELLQCECFDIVSWATGRHSACRNLLQLSAKVMFCDTWRNPNQV